MIQIERLGHRFGDRAALEEVSLEIKDGEVFGFLGPNGSGKTTLFRILSTAFAPSSGRVLFDGLDLQTAYPEIRRKIGVVFQTPSLDGKLTVSENLRHYGYLFGLSGKRLGDKISGALRDMGLLERKNELVEKLSGGLKRRVELAKALLNEPRVFILDEPSTGLDPLARKDFWQALSFLSGRMQATVLVTTHLMDEADRCCRVAILDRGRLIKVGEPESLKAEIGGDVLLIEARGDAPRLASRIQEKFQVKILVMDEMIQIEHPKGEAVLAKIIESFPGEIGAVTFRYPTLEDVFIHHTSRRFEGS